MSGRQAEPEGSTTLLSLPLDLVKSILLRLQVSDRLALLCVSRRWNSFFRESSLWTSITLPKFLAAKVNDCNFEFLVANGSGHLLHLDVSGSKISSISLHAFIESGAAASHMCCICLKDCSRLSGVAIVDFIKELTSQPFGCTLNSLYIGGCNLLTPYQVECLREHVQFLDVGVCVCSRVDVLHRCSTRDCQGLCKRCMTAYKFCGVECGICSSPSSERQEELLRVVRQSLQNLGLRRGWPDFGPGNITGTRVA
eukprot:SM000342S12975  [mRNA]  locus=s342:10204:11915:- [translate_table: standard]